MLVSKGRLFVVTVGIVATCFFFLDLEQLQLNGCPQPIVRNDGRNNPMQNRLQYNFSSTPEYVKYAGMNLPVCPWIPHTYMQDHRNNICTDPACVEYNTRLYSLVPVVETLTEFVLLHYNTTVWATRGTELCIVREGRLCTGDSDVDVMIGVLSQAHADEIIREFEHDDLGFHFAYLDGTENHPYYPFDTISLCACAAGSFWLPCHVDAPTATAGEYNYAWWLPVPALKATETMKLVIRVVSNELKVDAEYKKLYSSWWTDTIAGILSYDTNNNSLIDFIDLKRYAVRLQLPRSIITNDLLCQTSRYLTLYLKMQGHFEKKKPAKALALMPYLYDSSPCYPCDWELIRDRKCEYD